MKINIKADDGDEIAVQALTICGQGFVRVDFMNVCHSDPNDFDWMTLSAVQAKEFASALLTAADLVKKKHAVVN
jgi:hypothetical protein